MFKKIGSILLIAAMSASIAACGSQGDKPSQAQQNAAGYSETEIGANSGLKWPGASRLNSKNQLVVLDRGDGTKTGFALLDRNGKAAGSIQCSLTGMVRAFTLDSKDYIYALVSNGQNRSDSQQLDVISPSGQILKTVDLGTVSEGGNNPMKGMGFTDIAVDSNGGIYLADPSNGVQVLDKDGRQVKTIGSQGCMSVDVTSDGGVLAYSMGMGKNGIEKYDVGTGKSLWSIDLSSRGRGGMITIGSSNVRYSKADNSIYYNDGEGIVKYDSTGKPVGDVLDFKDYTILASGYTVSNVCLGASGDIFVTSTSGGAGGKMMVGGAGAQGGKAEAGGNGASAAPSADMKFEMYRYSVQSAGEAKKQKTITISVPVSDRQLEMAASIFQKNNPGYRTNIETYPSGDGSGSDYDTYVKNLNTKIMSGDGPDIISVAGLPYNNYISKNILADLSDMIKKDSNFNINDYYTNILDALKTNGKLYVMPTGFSFLAMMANQTVLDQLSIKIDDSKWTLEDFKSIAEKVTQKGGKVDAGSRSALPSISADNLLSYFVGGSYSDFINWDKKTANFDSAGFIGLLNTVKSMGSDVSSSGVKENMVSILEAAGRGGIVFYPQNFTDYDMYGMMRAAFKNQLSLYNMPSVGGSSDGGFLCGALYAISSTSKYKQESWDILKTLVSFDVQSSLQTGMTAVKQGSKAAAKLPSGGFSINRAAQQQKAQQYMDASKNGKMKMMIGTPEGSLELSPTPMTQADLDAVNRLIAGLKTYVNADQNVLGIVQDETKAFFSGEKSAEETAKLIQDRVSTYLGE